MIFQHDDNFGQFIIFEIEEGTTIWAAEDGGDFGIIEGMGAKGADHEKVRIVWSFWRAVFGEISIILLKDTIKLVLVGAKT
jgi:hypothetical protein